MDNILINRLTIIGVGLIGGSLALSLKRAGVVGTITGAGRNEANLQRAIELGVIDSWSTDIAVACKDADVVVVCVPLGAMRRVFEAMKPALTPEMVITDVGSAKQSVVNDAIAAFGELPEGFVPGHPIAGNENSGVDYAFAELYDRRRVIITPVETSAEHAIRLIRDMWLATKADVCRMEVKHHDEVLAATSHLPHMLAFGLVDTLADMDETDEIFEYAAGGFRDFTRIASSDPTMWRDICIANHDAISSIMERYVEDMQRLAKLVRDGDSERLYEMFFHAKETRDRFSQFLTGPARGELDE